MDVVGSYSKGALMSSMDEVGRRGFRMLRYLVNPAEMCTLQTLSWLTRNSSQGSTCRVRRVRLHHLSNTVGGSSLVVNSLHKRPFIDQEQGHHHQQHAFSTMAQQAKFAYTVVYVPDVQQAVDFWEKAFGVKCRSVDKSKRWREMESGATTIAFTPLDQRETHLTGGVQTADLSEQRHNVELSFSYPDVDAAFKHAVEAGAVPVAQPEDKQWGQRVGYVRDINGVMIRMGSFVEA